MGRLFGVAYIKLYIIGTLQWKKIIGCSGYIFGNNGSCCHNLTFKIFNTLIAETFSAESLSIKIFDPFMGLGNPSQAPTSVNYNWCAYQEIFYVDNRGAYVITKLNSV